MKRFFYAIAVLLATGLVISCENEPKNPGDFSKECTLSIEGPIVSLVTGKSYSMKVARETDTVYRYLYVIKDTVFDDAGKPVLGPDGQPLASVDSVYINSKIKARLIEMEPVYLPALADTFSIDIHSNARWLAAAPTAKDGETLWFFNHNSSTTGGVDSWLQFRTIRNRSNVRPNVMWQQVITSDSTIMYRIPFMQYGQKDQPEGY